MPRQSFPWPSFFLRGSWLDCDAPLTQRAVTKAAVIACVIAFPASSCKPSPREDNTLRFRHYGCSSVSAADGASQRGHGRCSFPRVLVWTALTGVDSSSLLGPHAVELRRALRSAVHVGSFKTGTYAF